MFRLLVAVAQASKESMEAIASGTAIDFYDSNTGKMLFTAPKGRTMEEFVAESKSHGWVCHLHFSVAPLLLGPDAEICPQTLHSFLL